VAGAQVASRRKAHHGSSRTVSHEGGELSPGDTSAPTDGKNVRSASGIPAGTLELPRGVRAVILGVNDPASPAFQVLVRACRDQLRSHGVAQLAGFLTPFAVSQMLTLASQLTSRAWASGQVHTAYLELADESAGPGHPRALLQHSAKKAIAYDQIPRTRRSAGSMNPMTSPASSPQSSASVRCTAAPTRWTPWRSRSSATAMSLAGTSTTASSRSP
jgi:hypothetical protein